MNQNQTTSIRLYPPVIAGVPTGRVESGFFDPMNEYKFEPEYKTEVFINVNGGISITQEDCQEDVVIIFSSKKRAVDVANAILALAEVATFEPETTEGE